HVESGSNENGYYMRWSDGKQECWMSTSDNDGLAPTTKSGEVYRSSGKYYDFPKVFDSSYPISVSTKVASVNRWANAAQTNSDEFLLYQFGTKQSSTAYRTTVHAAGRWK